MPIKLIEPSKARRTPYFSGRGTHRGVHVDRSTKSTSRREAKTIITGWEREIERGEYGEADAVVPVVEIKRETTFADAALAYLKADGDRPIVPSPRGWLPHLLPHLWDLDDALWWPRHRGPGPHEAVEER